MTTASILAVSNHQGGRWYVGVAGDRRCDGKTPGEALDSMTAQAWSTRIEHAGRGAKPPS
jgi:hypothetical protein